MKKRIPANCKGDMYCKPIFTPAKAVDHNRQAIMAKKAVVFNIFRIKPGGFEFDEGALHMHPLINRVLTQNLPIRRNMGQVQQRVW